MCSVDLLSMICYSLVCMCVHIYELRLFARRASNIPINHILSFNNRTRQQQRTKRILHLLPRLPNSPSHHPRHEKLSHQQIHPQPRMSRLAQPIPHTILCQDSRPYSWMCGHVIALSADLSEGCVGAEECTDDYGDDSEGYGE